jgi:hypothetical protein
VAHAVIEKIFFRDKWVRQYEFNRVGGLWMLQRINNMPIDQNANASFIKFYERFSTDSLFQVESLSPTVDFVGPDPDDDFAQMEGVITPDFWDAFAPELPHGTIYNIVYGHPHTHSNVKIFLLRGIANGMEVALTFRREHNEWKLTKLSE